MNIDSKKVSPVSRFLLKVSSVQLLFFAVLTKTSFSAFMDQPTNFHTSRLFFRKDDSFWKRVRFLLRYSQRSLDRTSTVWRKFEYFEYFLLRFSILSRLSLVSLSPLFFPLILSVKFCSSFALKSHSRKKKSNGRRRTPFCRNYHGKICFSFFVFTFKRDANCFLFQKCLFAIQIEFSTIIIVISELWKV